MADNLRLPPIRTSTLLIYLFTLYAAIGELLLIASHILGGAKKAPAANMALTAFVAVVAVMAYQRRSEFQILRRTGGQIDLTFTQAVIVTLFVVALGCLPILFPA